MRTIWITILMADVLLSAQPSKARQVPAGDWPLYSRDYASTRFSPLAQINTRNVGQLVPAWTYSMRSETPSADSAKAKGKGGGAVTSEATPIVVNGMMYIPAGNRVVALDAESGKEVWRYALASGTVANRALGYWPGED